MIYSDINSEKSETEHLKKDVKSDANHAISLYLNEAIQCISPLQNAIDKVGKEWTKEPDSDTFPDVFKENLKTYFSVRINLLSIYEKMFPLLYSDMDSIAGKNKESKESKEGKEGKRSNKSKADILIIDDSILLKIPLLPHRKNADIWYVPIEETLNETDNIPNFDNNIAIWIAHSYPKENKTIYDYDNIQMLNVLDDLYDFFSPNCSAENFRLKCITPDLKNTGTYIAITDNKKSKNDVIHLFDELEKYKV